MSHSRNVYLSNLNIHEEAKMDPLSFRQRLNSVKAIRTGKHLKFTFYPTDRKEIKVNNEIWEFVNGNYNALNKSYRKFFSIQLPESLYLFLKYSSKQKIHQPIILSLAAMYLLNEEKRSIMAEQLDLSTFKKVRQYIDEYFFDFLAYNVDFIDDESNNNSNYYSLQQQYDTLYKKLNLNSSILPHIYPFDPPFFHDFSKVPVPSIRNNAWDMEINCSYFSDIDWKNVVIEGINDSLKRVEASEEAWAVWLYNFDEKIRLLEAKVN